MATQAMTTETLNERLDEHDIVLLDFWAEWCGPCHQFSPIFEQASDRHLDVLFGKVNVDEQRELAAQFGVQSIPTLAVIRDRVIVFAQPGVLPAAAIDQVIEQVRELDMEQIHEEIAQEQPSS